MRRSLGSVLGLASWAVALVTGPITHIHPGTESRAAVCHAHFLVAHPVHPLNGAAAFDDDDDHARASYVNPYLSVAADAGSRVIALTRAVAAVAPPTVMVHTVSVPTGQAHGPPCVAARLLRGPPLRPTFA